MKGNIISLLLYICVVLSIGVLLFNGMFGFFILSQMYGETSGLKAFIGISVFGIITALLPVLFKKDNKRFYYWVILLTNVLVAFYPVTYRFIAKVIISRLL
ncbi:hypothetical protein IM538_22125 [Cytobacillus suaedae]|nr:hypothetical protein IM538_22125 [Cytobacillus suaedae]